MQPAPDNQPMMYGQPQQVMIDPNTGMPQNVIVIQQPSSAAKVVGILVIIAGVLGVLGELINIPSSLELGALWALLSVANLGINGGLIAGGVMMTNFQKRGVHLALICIVASAIIGVISMVMLSGAIQDFAEEEGLSEEEAQIMEDSMGAFAGIGAIAVIICNGICGLIIAIPLMISNNGLDQSSLFG